MRHRHCAGDKSETQTLCRGAYGVHLQSEENRNKITKHLIEHPTGRGFEPETSACVVPPAALVHDEGTKRSENKNRTANSASRGGVTETLRIVRMSDSFTIRA